MTKKQKAKIQKIFFTVVGWFALVMLLYGKEINYLRRYRWIRITSFQLDFAGREIVKSLRNIKDSDLLMRLDVFRDMRTHWWAALAVFFSVLIISNLFNSQFLLPVSSWKNRLFAFANFSTFMFGWRGPLVFVKDGKIISHLGEKDRKGPGVALVYSNNAVAIGNKVHGPGVVFTWKKGKKVKAVLDLRKQVRTQGRGDEEGDAQKKVGAVTRDGIKVSTDIEVQFSISAPPEIIYLTMTGDETRKEDLRFLQLDDRGDVITEISECRFNDEELNEIFHVAQKLIARNLDKIPFVDLQDYAGQSMYNQDRVQECYSNQPLDSDGEKRIQWHELPITVAAEEFRNTIVRYPFDELFLPPDYSTLDGNLFRSSETEHDASTRVMAVEDFIYQDRYPLEKVRREYANAVQHSGFVAYKLVKKVGRGEIQVGDRLSELMELSVQPVQLTSPQPLRRSQITVTSVRFGELDPVNEEIREQTKLNLVARWNKEADKTRVGYDEKAAVIRSRAKAQVQHDTVYSLRYMLLNNNQARTALILRIFQALEAATTESDNKEMTNMIKMLGDIRKWFNLEQADQGKEQ